jgi:hypothetical protein
MWFRLAGADAVEFIGQAGNYFRPKACHYYQMVAILSALVVAISNSSPTNTSQLVARFADLPEVLLSQSIANTPQTRWLMLDRTVNELPWAQKAMKRPDLIQGWQTAFNDCPASRGVTPSRFENLKALLSYAPFVGKEVGHERELLDTRVKRCTATKTDLPVGPSVRFARVAYPRSRMAHLFDSVNAPGDGAQLIFRHGQSPRLFDSEREQAISELRTLVDGAKSSR